MERQANINQKRQQRKEKAVVAAALLAVYTALDALAEGSTTVVASSLRALTPTQALASASLSVTLVATPAVTSATRTLTQVSTQVSLAAAESADRAASTVAPTVPVEAIDISSDTDMVTSDDCPWKMYSCRSKVPVAGQGCANYGPG